MIEVALTRRSHLRQLCRNDPLRGGDKPGRWHLIAGCCHFLTFGAVQPPQLRQLTRGYCPATGETVPSFIRLQGGRKRFLGIHYVFEAPPTWSICWAFARDDARRKMETAFGRAVENTVHEYIQPEIACCRLDDGTISPAKIAPAQFIRITRPDGAMHYRAHVLIPPLGLCPDGSYHTLKPKGYFQRRGDTEAFFHLALEYQCKKLGLQFYRPFDGNGRPVPFPELKNVPNDIRRHFFPPPLHVVGSPKSQRRSTHLASAEVLTRNGKYHVPPREELFSAWRQEVANKHLKLEWTRNPDSEIPKPLLFQEYSRLVRQATCECTQGAGHFHRKDFFREAFLAALGRGGVDPFSLHAALSRDLDTSPGFVKLGIRNGVQRFSTPEIQEVERDLLSCVEKLRTSHNAVQGARNVSTFVEATLRELHAEFSNDSSVPLCPRPEKKYYLHLDRLGKEAMLCTYYATSGKDRIKVIHGATGSIRNSVAAAIAEAYQLAGCATYAAAPSPSSANDFMKQTGVPSATAKMSVARFCPVVPQKAPHHIQQIPRNTGDLKTCCAERTELDANSVLFVTEASKVALRDLTLLANACVSAGTTMVLFGDGRERPALDRGTAFGSVISQNPGFELKSPRQKRRRVVPAGPDNTSRAAREEALKANAKLDRLHVARTADEARNRLIDFWANHGGADNPQQHRIVAASHEEIRRLNDMAQQTRLDAGKLRKSPSITVNGETFFRGDCVVFTERRGESLRNSEVAGTIARVRNNRLHAGITLDLANAKPREIPLRTLLQGENVRLTRAYAVAIDKLKEAYAPQHTYVCLLGAMTDRELKFVTAASRQHCLDTFIDEEHAGITLSNLARKATEAERELRPQHSIQREPTSAIGRRTNVNSDAVICKQSQHAELRLTLEPEN
jgi:hypothetical protein